MGPKFNDEISFRLGTDDLINVEIWDAEDMSKNRLIAVSQIKAQTIVQKGEDTADIPVYYKKKPAGDLTMKMRFEPDPVKLDDISKNYQPNEIPSHKDHKITDIPDTIEDDPKEMIYNEKLEEK